MKLIDPAAPQTMTSREIADLTDKRHDNVLRTINGLHESGAIELPQVEEVSNPGAGPRTIRHYRVGKRDSFVIVAQLSPLFTARLVDRWQELEAAAALPAPVVPHTLSGALRLAAEQAELIEQQQAALAAAAPAVEFVDRYVDASGLLGFRQVCKVLKAKENAFRQFLLEKKIAYRLGRELAPHAEHMNAGRFEVKAGVSTKNEHAFNSMRFTPKGVSWVAGEFAKYQLAMQAHH